MCAAPGTNFTSGALYSDDDRKKQLAAETARLAALRDDESLPLVFLDVAIKGKLIGRIHFVLFTKDAPRAAENFRQLCTGQWGGAAAGQDQGKAARMRGRGGGCWQLKSAGGRVWSLCASLQSSASGCLLHAVWCAAGSLACSLPALPCGGVSSLAF